MASYGELHRVYRGAPTTHSPAGGADRGAWAGGGPSLRDIKKCFVCEGSPVLSAGVYLGPVRSVFLARTCEDHSGFGGRCDIACRRGARHHLSSRKVSSPNDRDARRAARGDAQETIDYSAYEDQIRKLVDRQVIGQEVKEADGAFLINELGVDDDPSKWSKEKTRNETDLIRSRLKKTIEQELNDDPYAQVYFSELLRQAIAEAAALFEHPFKQYALFKDIEEKVDEREVDGIPERLHGNRHARAYFGIIKLSVGDTGTMNGKASDFAETAIRIENVVRGAVAEHSLNPQNIEDEIRKALLPELFDLLGLDQAKQVIDQVIAVTRVGLARGDL